MTPPPSWLRTVLLGQALYYVLSGMLPLVSMSLFESFTGPKTDTWLVRMVGLLALSIGIVIGSAARRRRITPEILCLSVLSGLSFAAIDVTYVLKGTIASVYLSDAAVEVVMVAAVVLRGGLG